MNNARYLRELDFARFLYYDRSGIYGEISAKGGGAVQGASTIRYRRPLPLFTPYKVTTKVKNEPKHNKCIKTKINKMLTNEFI